MPLEMLTGLTALIAATALSTQTDEGVPLTTPPPIEAEIPAEIPIEAQDIVASPSVKSANDLEADGAPLEARPLVFTDKSDAEVTQVFVDYLEGISTLQGKFYQQSPSGKFSSGKFYIKRPGLLRFEYEPDQQLVILANGGLVYVHEPALKQAPDSYPLSKTPLKFLLRKKIDLRKANIAGIERGVDAAAITLTAKDDETVGDITLVFGVHQAASPDAPAEEVELIRWVVTDGRGGKNIVDLDDVVTDAKLNNNLFRVPESRSPFLKD